MIAFGRTLYVVGAIALIATLVAPFFAPNSWVKPLQNLPAKLLLAVLIDAVIIFIGLIIVKIYFVPNEVRSAYSGLQFSKALAVIGALGPVGFSAIEKVRISDNEIFVDFTTAASASAITLLVGLTAVLGFQILYIWTYHKFGPT